MGAGGPKPGWAADPLGGLTLETACALLEERGYRRHEIGALTREYVARVVCHPRDADGRVDVGAHDPARACAPGRPGGEGADPLDDLRWHWRVRGWPERLVDAKARRSLEEE